MREPPRSVVGRQIADGGRHDKHLDRLLSHGVEKPPHAIGPERGRDGIDFGEDRGRTGPKRGLKERRNGQKEIRVGMAIVNPGTTTSAASTTATSAKPRNSGILGLLYC